MNKTASKKYFLRSVIIIFMAVSFGSPLWAVDDEETWKGINLEARDLLLAGKKEQAIEAGEKALKFAREKLGQGHPSVAKSMNNLGVLHFSQGNSEKARAYYVSALEFEEQHLGKDHPFVADTLINDAKLNFLEGRFAESLSALERALAVREKRFGAESLEVGQVLTILIPIYQRMGLSDEAEETRLRLLQIPHTA